MDKEKFKERVKEIKEQIRLRKEHSEKCEPKWPYEMFGIECGKGWEKLYRPIIEYIERYNKDHDDKIEIHQIKEKFGGLRFYTSRYTDELRKMIADAESESYGVCEECGKPCGTIRNNFWIYTLCQDCFNSFEKRREERFENIRNKIKEKKN